jgi:CubicO group peptidase (beta-lactamase class C family)
VGRPGDVTGGRRDGRAAPGVGTRPACRRGRRTARALLPLALLATPAAAQEAPHARAVAAGYKASILCGAIFNGGRSQADAEAQELAGIYPEYRALVAALPATVDRAAGTVAVPWSDTLPPRHSVWRRGTGCVTDPPGAAARNGDPAPPPRAPDPRPWPQGDAGIAPGAAPALAPALDRAFAGGYGEATRTVSAVIVKDGRVIAERYAPGWGPFAANRTWSVAKSIAGTLVGMAAAEGAIDPAAPAPIPEWQARGDPRARITTDQLLRMASGLHSDTAGNRTDPVYFGGTAVTERTTGWPLDVAPGTRFRYANNDILLAVRGLRATLGEQNYAALPGRLFARLGMASTVAETDWRGNFILSSQAWSTARDLARLGLLWLNDGVWQGERLLPVGWMAAMTRPAGPQPASGPGYGATLWLFGPDQGLPAGSYAAQGNRGQFVMVIPSRKLVIVRRGEDPGGRFDIARFAADVLAAVE